MLVSWSLLFTATMVASMATLNAIAEEKEKHTLRTLMLANVSAEQMLASRGLVTLLAIALVDAACYLVIGQPLGRPAGRSSPSAWPDRCPSCCCRFCWGWWRATRCRPAC